MTLINLQLIAEKSETLEEVMQQAWDNDIKLEPYHLPTTGIKLDILHPRKDYAIVKEMERPGSFGSSEPTFIHPYGSAIGYMLNNNH